MVSRFVFSGGSEVGCKSGEMQSYGGRQLLLSVIRHSQAFAVHLDHTSILYMPDGFRESAGARHVQGQPSLIVGVGHNFKTKKAPDPTPAWLANAIRSRGDSFSSSLLYWSPNLRTKYSISGRDSIGATFVVKYSC